MGNSFSVKVGNIKSVLTLKDEFEAFWEYAYTQSAESFLNGWITAALKSRLKAIKNFALMLRSFPAKVNDQ